MYTKKQVEEALRFYRKCGSATLTVRCLGYPSRTMLYNWAENDEKAKNPRKENGALHCPSKPRFSVDDKINAVKRCFEGKEPVESVAREIGCSNVTIYNWRNKYIREGVFSLMDENRKNELKML